MKVAIIKDNKLDYNSNPPFHPSQNYPEYPFKNISKNNLVYDSIRKMLFMLEMDKENYGKKIWNPLGDLIKPQDSVLIKPNMVEHYNAASFNTDALLTNGLIIRAILDYVYIALKGVGTIIIGDAPLQTGDFEKTIKILGLDKITEFYNKNTSIKINLIDFRKEISQKNKLGFLTKKTNSGDPLGYTVINLKNDSEFYEINKDYKKFRVTNYDKKKMLKHHNEEKNEYSIPNSVLKSDIIINLPKLKSHRKAGITCSLKNLIGINGSKDWLPHHRIGSTEEGGDEYLYKSARKKILTKLNERMDTATNKLKFFLWRLLHFLINRTKYILPFPDPYFEGSWYGNDTIPRTITDINKIAFYADKNGKLQDKIQRKMFIIVDAVIAGEKEGPLEPSPKKCGILVAGHNPVAVDLVSSRIMGFDYKKIPTFKYALNSKNYSLFNDKLENIKIYSQQCQNFNEIYDKLNCHFIPSSGWKGYIEYKK